MRFFTGQMPLSPSNSDKALQIQYRWKNTNLVNIPILYATKFNFNADRRSVIQTRAVQYGSVLWGSNSAACVWRWWFSADVAYVQIAFLHVYYSPWWSVSSGLCTILFMTTWEPLSAYVIGPQLDHVWLNWSHQIRPRESRSPRSGQLHSSYCISMEQEHRVVAESGADSMPWSYCVFVWRFVNNVIFENSKAHLPTDPALPNHLTILTVLPRTEPAVAREAEGP